MPIKAAISVQQLPVRGVALLSVVLAVLVAPHLKAQTSVTYLAGASPIGIAFDGTDIWVTNGGVSTVTKLLASTGAVVGTYSVGLDPWGIAFDGTNIWVVNEGIQSGSVTKLLASTGATVGTYAVGRGPQGIAFDGVNIWVTNSGSSSVTKLLASTGATVGTYPVGPEPYGVVFDGTDIWVTNASGNSVTKLLASTGATVGTYLVGSAPIGVAFDGVNIWVAGGSNNVTKLLASTGATVGTYPVGSSPTAIVFDGSNIWVTGSNTVTKINPASPPTPSISPAGIVPLFSTIGTIQPGEWISVWGKNLANGTTVWNSDFPTSLGGTSVTIFGKSAYLWFVSPGQINLQVPDYPATFNVGMVATVAVVVTTPGGSATQNVALRSFAPSFSLIDAKHVAGIILRTSGSGAYGGGTYDVLGPTGASLGFQTVAANPGDVVELFGVGFGPTSPPTPAGQVLSGASAPYYGVYEVQLAINGKAMVPSFTGLTEAGLYQINLTIPAGLGTGDLDLVATVGGVQTQSGVVISLQ